MDRQLAINMLVVMAEKQGRLPKKSDFSPVEVSQIKAKLGAWNRALELANLKSISPLYMKKLENKKKEK